MTLRAVVLGLLGAAFIAGVGYINDFVIKLTYLVGNDFPIFIFGGLVLFLMVVNPLLRLVRMELTRREIATVLALMLSVCCIPSSGLLRTFTTSLVMPAHLATLNADWKRNRLLSYVPDNLLASKVVENRVVSPFMQGLGTADAPIDVWRVPWDMTPMPQENDSEYKVGLARALKFWVPVVLLTFLGLLGLGLVVHRQWSSNELLRYPIVEFASGIMEQEPGKLFAKVFYNKLFWIGLAVPLFIHIVNGRYAWLQTGIQIPMNVDMTAQYTLVWPSLFQTDRAWGVCSPRLYITVAAFSYLLASEIGLSLGISNLLYSIVAATLVTYNADISYDYWMGGLFSYQVFGSYVGLAIIILYAGRNYYWAVLRRAFGIPARQQVTGYSVWGARVFLACMSGACFLLARGGLDPVLAVVVMLMITLMLLVIGRINAETGLFFIQPAWPVAGCIVGMFGMQDLGPKMFILLGLAVTILAADPRESIMPFILNSLKLSEKVDLRPGRAAPWMAVAIVLGLAVGLPVVLWAQYNYGVTSHEDTWMTQMVPGYTFQSASKEVDKLRSAGTLEGAGDHAGLGFLWHMRPNQRFLMMAAMGLGLVLVLNFARLRWNWWPFHPVLFLVWSSVPLAHFAASFLFGWIIRALVVKLGGGKTYQSVKPLMYGFIAGDLLGGLLFMGIGAGYHLTRGLKPKLYQIFPF